MNRRRFLQLLTTAAAAVAVSPYWTPTPELLEPPAPPAVYSGDPWRRLTDPTADVSIRFIQNFQTWDARPVTRIDVLYGFGSVIQPAWSMRVTDKRLGARARRRARRRAKRQPTLRLFNPPALPHGLQVFTVKGIHV